MPLTGPAAARLYDDHVDAIHAAIARRVGERLAPAVVGEVFEQAVHSWGRFEASDGTERGFLYGVVSSVLRRHAADEQTHLRQWTGAGNGGAAVADPLMEGTAADDTDASVNEAMHAVADLAPDDRDILLLVAWENGSPGMVAEALGLPVGTVRSSLTRVRRDLKRQRVRTETVEQARPHVAPMPAADRRRAREMLFSLGASDVGGAIGRRSASGAVVATAPAGARGRLSLGVTAPGRSSSLPRVAAGLVTAMVVAVIGWAVFIRDDGDDQTVAPATSPATSDATEPTVPPSSATPTTVTRTGVSAAAPLLLPDARAAVEQVQVDAPARGSSALFQAIDGSMAWLVEVDGDARETELDVTTTGALEVGVPDEGADPPIYEPVVPCGTVLLFDAPGVDVGRAEITLLLEAMTRTEGDLAVGIPGGWSLVEDGPFTANFRLRFAADLAGEPTTVTLVQSPGGSIAQFAFGGQQFTPAVFLDQPAWLRRAPTADGEVVAVVWRDEDTVFELSALDVTAADLEQALAGFTPGAVADWEVRFGRAQVDPTDPPSDCTPQPSFSIDP